VSQILDFDELLDEKESLSGKQHLTSTKNQFSHGATSEIEVLLGISDVC
jgi:hypothetical protein